MPVCLYCRAPTTGREAEAHVLPEAIVTNDLLLPPGSMCYSCNNYFSCLDSALANHPIVAFGIQVLGLPGKRGKPRELIGPFQRTGDDSSSTVTIQRRHVKLVRMVGGRPFIGLQPPRSKSRSQFHRALYYVAFNFMSRFVAADELLGTTYDPVRRYIRSPLCGEVWPYCHSILVPEPVDIIDLFGWDAPTPQVVMRFFNHAFAVDLFRTTTLHQYLTAQAPDGVKWFEIY